MYCPAKIKVDQNWLFINSQYLSVRALDIFFFFFFKGRHLGFGKQRFAAT
jgi:hypothetical protein